LCLHLGEGPVQYREQPAGIEVEACRAELQGLAAYQRGQAGRQLISPGHPRPVHQNWDDAYVAGQGSLDLQPHEVSGIVEAAPPMLVGDRQPLIADQRQQHIAGPDCSGDHLDEVVAQLDRVDVLEDLAAAEVVGEPVEQPAGRVGGLLPPVADEDPTRSRRRGFSHGPHLVIPILSPGAS
jgi:hypothetical protein